MAKISINLKDGSIERESEQPAIVGIDLGTTNSLVAYIVDGQAVILKNERNKHQLVPSVIHLAQDGETIVGDRAKPYLESNPERTIYSVKRLMGKSYNDLSQMKSSTGYKILETDQDELVKIKIDERFFTPIELSSSILKELKTIAEQTLDQQVEKAVITVPAYFNDTQRQATRDAGKLAGLDVLRIVNEPTAAALAYGIGSSDKEEEVVAIYDLGGGTFDISILHIQGGIFEVLSTHGDTYLGGDDFDRAIVQYWIDNSSLDPDQVDVDKTLGQQLRLKAEEAKKSLSTQDHFTGEVNGISLKLSVTEFNSLIQPIVKKTIESCSSSLSDAEMTIDQIDSVIMVGGSTRVPLVKTMVSEFFNQEVFDNINPDEVVALGAAIQADILAGNRSDMLLLDITPLSLGIETIGGLMDSIIPRNSKVPTKAGRQYTTSVDGQTNLKVSVYQGERDLVGDNRKLGEFILKGIPPMAAGMPKIDIQFIIDADGILRVKASELRSKVETEVQIKSQYGISEEEMALMLRDSMIHAQGDMDQRALIEARNEGQNVVSHTDKFIKQNGQWLAPEDITQLQSFKKELIGYIESGNKDDINNSMERLNEYSRPLAEKALDYNIQSALKGKEI